jgi:excisionase family DNA binding protein
MNNKEVVLYQIEEDSLKNVIREIFKEELKIIEDKFNSTNSLITREKASQIASVCPKTISRWVDEDRLTNYSIGRKILINENELKKHLKNKQ